MRAHFLPAAVVVFVIINFTLLGATKLAAQEPSPSLATAPRSASPAAEVQGIIVRQLMEERFYWSTRYTSRALPASTVAVGLATVVLGSVLFALQDPVGEYVCTDDFTGSSDVRTSTCRQPYRRPHRRAGNVLMATGGAAAMIGLAALLWQTPKHRQARHLRRIDAELKAHGVEASLSAWVGGKVMQPGGGLTAAIRF